MAREKNDVYTSLRFPVSLSGSGGTEQHRIYVHQDVHAGPKTVEGREVRLILDDSETLYLAVGLFGMLPATFFDNLDPKDRECVERLKKMIKLAEVKPT